MAGKIYIPTPDMLVVSNEAKKLRGNITKFLPNIGLSMINYGRCFDIDKFYIKCQEHRDWYKDNSGKIAKVDGFETPPKRYASRPDPTSVYVKQPIKYKIEHQPVVYPVTTARQGRPPNEVEYKINLNGQYDATTCIRYKR